MKYYSEISGKLFNTEAECLAEENKINNDKEKKDLLQYISKKQLEVDDLINKLEETKEKFEEFSIVALPEGYYYANLLDLFLGIDSSYFRGGNGDEK